MHKKAVVLFVAFFLMVIYAVPVIDGFREIRSGEGLQPLDFFEDTFVAPLRRVNSLATTLNDTLNPALENLSVELEKAVVLAQQSAPQDSGVKGELVREEASEEEIVDPWAETDVYLKADDARWIVNRLQKKARKKNRHIEDKKDRLQYRQLDTLEQLLVEIFEIADQEGDVTEARDLLEKAVAKSEKLKKKYHERGIGSVPGLSLEAFLTNTFFSEHYVREYESEMENNSIFSKHIRPWMEYLRLVTLKDGGSKGLIGERGWYFYQPGFDYLVRPNVLDRRTKAVDYNDVAITENAVDRIAHVRDEFAAHGIDLVVVIVPGKPSVYPELINPNFPEDEVCTFSHSLVLIEELKKRNVNIVDLFHPYKEERKRDHEVGDSLYLRKDTHWKARGLLVAAEEVARHIKQLPWFEQGENEYMIDTLVVDRRGDVAEMVEIPNDTLPWLGDYAELEPTTCYQVSRVVRSTEGEVRRKIPFRRQSSREKFQSPILVMGDSFSRIYQSDEPRSAGWISHLGAKLGYPVEELVNDGGASTLVREMLSRKIAEYKEEKNSNFLKHKKVVVWEIVERDFRYGEKGWAPVPLFADAE